MNKITVLCLIVVSALGSHVLATALQSNASAQAFQSGLYQIVAHSGAPQAGAWRLNTGTGGVSFCSFAGSWRCVPVPEAER
jgi:hypothetical protein